MLSLEIISLFVEAGDIESALEIAETHLENLDPESREAQTMDRICEVLSC